MRSFDDIINERRAIASGPTPLPSTATLSTPANPYPRPVTPTDIWNQAFQPMTVAAHQVYGMQKTQQWNTSNPASMMGPAALNMMNMSNMASMRAPSATPAPALMTTPGMTGMFNTPGDIAAQQGLMSSSAFLDPRTASANLSSQRAHQFGQTYGGPIGMVAGTIGGGMLGGVGGAAGKFGGEVAGGMLGGWVGESVGNLPVVKQIREFMNADIANNLSWMAQAQHGTFGRVSMGSQDIGLGGRGMGASSAMKLGQKLKGLSGASGGMFNQMDMSNLTQAAGDAGLLDAAANIDQIANTVGSLMKVVGRLGKLTGDPDFRNNLKELGNLKQMGFSVDQAMSAMGDINRFARGAGMTRGQMGATMQAGAARSIGAGLTGGVGMMNAAVGAQQGRMMAGAFDPVQSSLMGGTAGISQTIEESRTAFAAQTAKLFIPSLLTIGENGEISLDQDKMRQLGGVGAINMHAMAAHGQQNFHRVAQQKAQQTGKSVNDVIAELMGRMPELQSKMANQVDVGQVQTNMILDMRKQFGEYTAARIVMGSEAGARTKMAELNDPGFYEKRIAQLQTNIEEQEGAARRQAGASAEHFRSRRQWWNRAGRSVGGFFSNVGKELWGEDASDAIAAQDEARKIDDQSRIARTGLTGPTQQRGGIGTNANIIREMRENATRQGEDLARGEGMGDFLRARMQEFDIAGEGDLDDRELIAYQRSTGEYGGFGAAATRLEYNVRSFFGKDMGEQNAVMRKRLTEVSKAKKPIQAAMKRSRRGFTDMKKSFMKEMNRLGKDGAAMMTAVKAAVLTKANAMGATGEGGGTLTPEQMKKLTYDTLVSQGMSGGTAQRFIDANPEFTEQMTYGLIAESGTPEAKAVLDETLNVGDLYSQYGVDRGKTKQIEQEIRAEGLGTMHDYDIVDEEQVWSELTERGTGRRFEDVEEREAHELFTGASKKGIVKGGKRGAQRRMLLAHIAAARAGDTEADKVIQKFEAGATGEDLEDLYRARDVYKEAGGDTREELARYLKGEEGEGGIRAMIAKDLGKDPSDVTMEEMTRGVERGQLGKGETKSLFFKEQIKTVMGAQKGGGATPADAGTYAAPAAGTPAAKEAESLKAQLDVVKATKDAWVGEGSIGDGFKKATIELNDAASKLRDAADALP